MIEGCGLSSAVEKSLINALRSINVEANASTLMMHKVKPALDVVLCFDKNGCAPTESNHP